ncbi:hypothetical protein TNCV_732141 [Trichonephila clavipes]|nr:hypothetical protein TNCV_732141 [Trichonephila clavipes]
MSRFGGLSEERPSVFETRSKLGTHLSTQCSEDALLQASLASLQRGQCPRRGKGETKEGTSERDRIRWDRKRGSRASAEQ